VEESIRENIILTLMDLNDYFRKFCDVILAIHKMDTSPNIVVMDTIGELVYVQDSKDYSEDTEKNCKKRENRLIPGIYNIIQTFKRPFKKYQMPPPDVSRRSLIIEDITKYLREDYTLDAKLFSKDFDLQTKTNYELLESLQTMALDIHLKTTVDNLQILLKRIPHIFQNSDVQAQLQIFRRGIQLVRDTLIEELGLLDCHYFFVQTLLENIHLDSFNPKALEMNNYMKRHRQTLDRTFSIAEDQQPRLPCVFPYFLQFKDIDYEITSITEFRMLQAEYKKIIQTVRLTDSIPNKWPQTLPNLSSHTGKPLLTIRDAEDYTEVLSSYNYFVRKMEAVRDDWTRTLRHIHPALLLISQLDSSNLL